ncbi:MAG: MFS transporter [Chlamydiia bacterium]
MKDKPALSILGLPLDFHSLNICQFLITLNDAIARMLIIFFLNDLLGIESVNRTLFLTSLVIVVPFLCFSMIGGQLADRYPKGKMIRWLQILAVTGAFILWFSMLIHNSWLVYVGLFLMALQSALFSPARLAIVPELVEEEKIPFANSIMTACNYIALLAGAFIASYVTILSERNFSQLGLIAVVISLSAVMASFGIHSYKHFGERPIEWNFIAQTIKHLKLTLPIPHLFHVIIFGSYFLLACLFTQLNLIPFGYQELGISDAETGYILLYTSFGLGLGVLCYGLVSRRNIEVSYAILGGLGTALSYFAIVLFSHSFDVVSFIGFLIGICGGFFIVPLNGFIQTRSPESIRASVLAASNTVGFIFLLLGALFLEISGEVFKFSAQENFLFLATLTLIMWGAFAYEFRYSFFRPFCVLAINLFYKIEGDIGKDPMYRLSPKQPFAVLGLMILFEPLRIIWDRPPSGFFKRTLLMLCSIQEMDLKQGHHQLDLVREQMELEGGILVISTEEVKGMREIEFTKSGRVLTFSIGDGAKG